MVYLMHAVMEKYSYKKSHVYNCSHSHVTLLDWLKVHSQHR